MSNKSSIALEKPQSVWERKIKFDAKPLFKAIGKATTHIATLKLDELGNDAIEAAASLGIETPVEELAFQLLRASLLSALTSLTKESLNHLADASIDDRLSKELELRLSNIHVTFNKQFFDSPGKQDFVRDAAEAYTQWLCDRGVAPHSASAIGNRLEAYYVFALSKEWRKNPQIYKKLLEHRDSPFNRAEETLLGWSHYFKFLRRRISENIFDESFSLDQIYVPLKGYYTEKEERPASAGASFRAKSNKICVDIEAELFRWLQINDKSDALRVISGGPGSGKSSLTRILCCKLAESGRAKPIFIPLHLIDPTRDVASEVERFVREEGLLNFNPLDSDRKEDNVLVVFDGLDELASMGKVAAQVARDFIQAVEKMIARRNWGEHPIYVIISGRELIIQENETEFRRPRQVLTLLPYFTPESSNDFKDPSGILKKDLRETWWSKYGALTGQEFNGLPAALKVREIDEITAQPLLNYLVALSYRRGKLKFTKRLNLNSVYADLVAAVHERGYEKSKTYGPISHIGQADFVRVLEEIALAAWHGSDGRSSSVRDILTHCQQSGLQSLLKSFTEGAEAGVTKLLAAFFFRRSGKTVGDDATFVFTHKSFGEYLTAIRLIRGLDRIVLERQRRKANADDGFDISEALTYWARLTGPAQMTEYIQTFIKREMAQRDEVEMAALQDVLTELMTTAVEAGFPLERLGNLPFATAKLYEANSSTSLLVCLNAVGVARQSSVRLSFKSTTSFGTFLRKMCPQRSGPQSPLLYSALSYLDLSEQCLDMFDFYGANLSHTKWAGSAVHFANFGRANLDYAEFPGANLSWCRFDGVQFSGTKFNGAILNWANFGHQFSGETNMANVIFRAADLRNSLFGGVNINDCEFVGAKLSKSTLHKVASISNCDIDQASIGESEKAFQLWVRRARAAGKISGMPILLPFDDPDLAHDD